MRVLLTATCALLLSACGHGGVKFDLDHMRQFPVQKEELTQIEPIINELIQGDCVRLALNDLPMEYADLKDSNPEELIEIQNVLPMFAIADAYGERIRLTWQCFSNREFLIGVLAHEITHTIGYTHPEYGQPGYDESFPQRARHALEKCYREKMHGK